MSSFNFNALARLSARMPEVMTPVPGVKYVAEFIDKEQSKVAVTWFTRDKSTWKAILDGIRKLPVRGYNSVTKKWEVPYDPVTSQWLLASGWSAPKAYNEEEVADRPDPKVRQKELIDATKLDPEGTLIPGLRPYQVDFLKFAQLRHGRLALGDEMGCIDGSMTVTVIYNGELRKVSLETLYLLWNSKCDTASMVIQCSTAGKALTYGEVVDVLKSGIKRCVHVTLSNGMYLIATSDHKVLTPNGWSEASKLAGKSVVYADGTKLVDMPVESIYDAGLRMTYDVKVLNYANFTANHVVVHNCGKTVEALSWMVYANAYPALYVVTAPTKLQWQQAYRKWVGATKKHYPDVEVISGRRPYKLTRDKSYIINWDILADWEVELANVGFRLLVGDEVQAIGNPVSQRAQAFQSLSRVIPHVIGMSGTPAMSKPLQFWTLLNVVEPQKFKNYYAYRNRYCDPKTDSYGTKYDGASNVAELHELLVGCMLRRTKSEVMKDLPPKVIEVVPLEVDKSAMDKYYEEERIAFSENTAQFGAENARDKVAGLLRSAYALKEKALLAWVHGFLESGEKLLLFAWHRSVVEVLMDELKEYNPVCIYGGMGDKERERSRVKFIEDDSCRIVVANILAGGVGIDGWQNVCSNVAFAEFAHTPTLHNQATDRLHRGGQSKSVTAYYLIADGTIDNDAMEVLDARAKMLDGVLDGKETATSDLLTELLERRGVRMPH